MASDDPFTSARSGFLSLEDLEGCLLLVVAHGYEMMPSNRRDQDPYPLYKCTVVVLDGTPGEAVEHNGSFPFTLDEFGIFGSFVGPQIKPSIKNGKPVLGRVISFKNKQGTTSYKLDEPTDADKTVAREPAIAMMQANNPFEDAK